MSGPQRYVATLCPGFEDVAAGEIEERLPGATIVNTPTGSVVFDYGGSPTALLSLRSVNNLSALVAELSDLATDVSGLDQLQAWAVGAGMEGALEILRALGREFSDPPTFRVTAHRVGTHSFTSQDAAGYVGAGVVEANCWPVDLRGYEVEVILHVSHDTAWLGVGLTLESLHRRGQMILGRAPLKPTAAYALLRLLAPEPGWLVVDPMCGTATLPVECRACFPEVRIVGGDVSAAALEQARTRVHGAGADIPLMRWDARRLPFHYQTVDGIVANMPFGQRVGSHIGNRHLYPGFIRELQRVLRPGGRAVLLTKERRLMERLILRQNRLRVVAARGVSLSNLRAMVFILEKTLERQEK